jgi:hypothetical protein
MPGATGHDLHIDQHLSNVAIGYRPEGFIADMIAPIVDVDKQSNSYVIWSRADRLRRRETQRSPGGYANRIEQRVSSDTYFAKNYALASPVTIEDRENADPIFVQGIVEGRTELVMDGLLLDWEVRVASQVTSGSNVGSYSAVSSAWDGSGDPLGDINTAIDNVHYSTGKMPNRVVFGVEAWKSFRRDSNVRDLIFGSDNGGGYPNTNQVAQLLDIDNVMVGDVWENTAEEGLAESLDSIWGDNVLVYYAPDNPNTQRPSFMYSFRWNRPGLPNMQVERHPYNSRTKSEDLEVGYYQDEKVTGSEYAFLLEAVNSST